MNETDYKLIIVKNIHKEGGYARRIEDQYSVGMPDMVLIPLRCPVIWAEVKVVVGNKFGPTPRQMIELKRLYRSPYSIPCVIGCKGSQFYISAPKDPIDIRECQQMQPGQTIGDMIREFVSHV